jgi:16S rRNA (guanine527-N7)-methyltransferase
MGIVFKTRLQELAPTLGEEQINLMHSYFELMVVANAEFNLTSIVEEDKAAELHFYDSIFCSQLITQNARVLDIGTGAGFPGIPLKIARPDIQLTVMDATGKKINFVANAAKQLDIEAEAVCARAEEKATGNLRESFDVCVSRAVASLRILCELCLPYVQVGGVFLAYKSDYEAELKEAAGAIRLLGGSFQQALPGNSVNNHAVLAITKIKRTPIEYPRRFARILKSPL